MNLYMIIIEALVFAGIFTAILFAYFRGDRKYSPASIHNYPPDIQEEYFKTHERVDVSYRSGNVLLTKSAGVLIFNGILLVCALIAGESTFICGAETMNPLNREWFYRGCRKKLRRVLPMEKD